MKKRDDRRTAGLDSDQRRARRQIYEIKSTYILQPGPAALTDGVAQLHAFIARAAAL